MFCEVNVLMEILLTDVHFYSFTDDYENLLLVDIIWEAVLLQKFKWNLSNVLLQKTNSHLIKYLIKDRKLTNASFFINKISFNYFS